MVVGKVAALTTASRVEAVLLLSLLTLHPDSDSDSDSDDEFFDALSDSHGVECQIEDLGSHFDHFDLDSESGQSSDEPELDDNSPENLLNKTMSMKLYSPLLTTSSQSITTHKCKSCIWWRKT